MPETPSPPGSRNFLRGFLRALAAVFSAMFGVRRGRAADRDWSAIRPLHIVAAGVAAVAGFVALLLAVVHAVVP